MVTDTEKSRRTNRKLTRPWRSRQRESLIILKVVSSSLTGRKSRRIILIALHPTIEICKKKKNYKQKVKPTEAFRTEKNVVSLIRNHIFKIIWFEQTPQKRI